VSRDPFHLPRLLRAPSNLALNPAREEAATASLGNLCQCLTTLRVKNFFLISSLNLLSFNLKPLPLLLSHFAAVAWVFETASGPRQSLSWKTPKEMPGWSRRGGSTVPLSLSSRVGPSAFGAAVGRVPRMLRCPAELVPGEQGRGHPRVTACSPSTHGSSFQASPAHRAQLGRVPRARRSQAGEVRSLSPWCWSWRTR